MEAYAKHYTLAFPFEEYSSGRPVARVAAVSSSSRQPAPASARSSGWERANWFAPAGVEPRDEYTYGRQNWFAHVGDEHRACREPRGAVRSIVVRQVHADRTRRARALDWICANHVTQGARARSRTRRC
jgi:4-methylaminobutanoate oxidase (formaldehyde-forming)